jgi:hypothetical protein
LCTNGSPFNYCGDIGDQCGGTLHCGADCGADKVCDATTGLCKGDATCKPIACENGSVFNYCGDIGDGCGGTLHCGSDCAAGQACNTATGLCQGDASCIPATCNNGTQFNYCGDVGDGCGGTLHCGADCAAHQLCGSDGVCTGDSTCVPIACANGTPFSYCGDIGDGCGGKVSCGAQCGAKQVCGADNLCKGDASCVPKGCSNGTSYSYCGTVGDGCGGAVSCGTSCGTGQVCDTSTDQCKGDSSCVKLTSCTNGTDFPYCGAIGDGCGGSLACPTTCGTHQVCDQATGLCKGDSTCKPITCTASNGGTYCGGPIGDGCGGSINCPATCPTGFTCESNACVCTSASCGLCTGLACQIAACDAGSTTVSGKVFTPRGASGDPVYNALVYIPNGALPAIVDGPSCDQCQSLTSDQTVAGAFSGPDGSFVITNAPTGTGIPLVVQLGKWRREITVDITNSCGDNPIPDGTVRLPASQAEGNIPLTAVATGWADALECVLSEMGVASSEFTAPTGTGRIRIYQQQGLSGLNGAGLANGQTAPSAATLWGGTGPNGGSGTNGQPGLSSYDMVLLPCAGDTPAKGTNPSTPGDPPTLEATDAAGYPNLLNYTNAGGRAFVTHYSWTFIAPAASSFPATANWSIPQGFTEVQETRYYAGAGSTKPIVDYPYLAISAQVNTSFAKGAGFAQWLVDVGAGTTTNGVTSITLNNVAHVADSVITGTTANPVSQAWLTSPLAWRQFTGSAADASCTGANPSTSDCIQQQFAHEFTFDTPVGSAAAQQCGRVVYSGFHVNQPASGTTPAYCTGSLTPQEQVLEFMLLDLASCISIGTPVTAVLPPPTSAAPPPAPPPPPPPPPASAAAPPPPPAPPPPAPPPPATSAPAPPTAAAPAAPPPPPPAAAPPAPPAAPPSQSLPTPPPPPPPPTPGNIP